MNIRAILRFKNDDFLRKRLIAGFKTQTALGKFIGVCQSTIGDWENLKNYPKKESHIKALELALNCEIDELFPKEIIDAIRKKIGTPIERIVSINSLPPFIKGEYLLPSVQDAYEKKEMAETLNEMLNKRLTTRERKILKLRIINEYTLDEVGTIIGLSGERINQIEAKALRKMRHPNGLKDLRQYLDIKSC